MEALVLLLSSLLERGRSERPSVTADATIVVRVGGHDVSAAIKIRPVEDAPKPAPPAPPPLTPPAAK